MKNINLKFLVILILAAFMIASCSRKVNRVDTTEVYDISGRWNDTDSRLTSEQLVDQVLNDNWLSNHVQASGEEPVVIVGFINNKSHEHIQAETFVKDLEQAFIQSNRVRLVQGGEKRDQIRKERADQQENASQTTMKNWGLEVGADYMMQGSINSIVDAHRREKINYYQVNLELTNIETNEVVWIGDKKIKKYVKN